MKTITYVALLGMLLWIYSCTKTDVILQPKDSNIAVNQTKTIVPPSITTDSLDEQTYDSCRREYVHLKGLETYILSEYLDASVYYIRYEIDLSDVIGTGDSSGIVYSGGGYIIDQTRVVFDNGSVSGRIKMKISFKSPSNGSITWTQNALLIQRNYKIDVFFDTGYIQSCK